VDEDFFLSSFSFLPPVTQASEHTNEQKEEKKMAHSRWPTSSAYREKCNLIIVVQTMTD